MGPSTFNFADAASAAEACGAMIRVADAAAFATTAYALLHDAERCAAMSACALQFAAAHRGATNKTIDLISDLVD